MADVRSFLAELGYTLLFREQGWSECLLTREDERWLGHGPDEDRALADALRQAMPSRLARALLERALTTEQEEAAPAPVTEPLPPAAPAIEIEDEVAPQHTNDVDEDDPNALVELRELQAKIDAQACDLAISSPLRQRLVLLAWMARARACQERASAHEVYFGVRHIASRLGTFAREWWPGSVPALQLAARPADALKNVPSAREPRDWAEVANLAEEELARIEASEGQRGYDEFGWRDSDSLVTPSPAAEATFKRVVGEIEAQSGPLGQPSSEVSIEPGVALRWANHVRALRGALEDVELWARAIGRLRFLCTVNKRSYGDVSNVLDPAYRPHEPWARVIGPRTPLPAPAPQKSAELAGLLALPLEQASIQAWLRSALPCTTDLQYAEVVEKVRPFASAVLALGPEDFSGLGRRVHRRLRRLQESLGAPPLSVEAPASVQEHEPIADVHHEQLRAKALLRTRGRRAVLVSNRIDRDLEKRLLELLELAELDSEEADPRRVDAVVEAIASRGYDIVLAATGFMNHTVDGKLSRACHQANIPYVRTNRARPTATLRALAV